MNRILFIAMLLLPTLALCQGRVSSNPVSLAGGAHYNVGFGPGLEVSLSHDRVLDRTTKTTGAWRARAITHSWGVEAYLPDPAADPIAMFKYSIWHRKGTFRGNFARQKWGGTDFICFGGSLLLISEESKIKGGLRPEVGINFPRLGSEPNSRMQRHRIKIVYGYNFFPSGGSVLEDAGHQLSLVYFREGNTMR